MSGERAVPLLILDPSSPFTVDDFGRAVPATATAAPTVTAIAPDAGPVVGGTAVTITGTNFDPATTVTIGGVPATPVMFVSSAQLSTTTPGGPAGAADVVATNGVGSGTLVGGYTYYAVPTVTSFNPTTGPAAGGTSVAITGTGFGTDNANVTVRFGTEVATITSPVSDSAIVVDSPAQTAGSVVLSVETPGGTANGPVDFVYT